MKTKTGKLRPRLDEDSHSNARTEPRPECCAEAADLSTQNVEFMCQTVQEGIGSSMVGRYRAAWAFGEANQRRKGRCREGDAFL